MLKFTLRDAKEIIIGSFVASLFFFALRFDEKIQISVTAGIIITLFVIFLSNPKPRDKNLDVFAVEILLVYITVSIMALVFKLATLDIITFGLIDGTFPNLIVLGSGVIIAFWIALPIAVLYNKKNLDNFLSRIFIKKR